MRKYIDIIREHEVLAEEVLEEGMLQKLAGLALGAVLALGPKVGQADTVYSYLDSKTNKMETVTDISKVPTTAKVVMSVDTDTNKVTVVRGGAEGQEVTPDKNTLTQTTKSYTYSKYPPYAPIDTDNEQDITRKQEKQKQLDIYRDKVTKAWEIYQKMVKNPNDQYRMVNRSPHWLSGVTGKYSDDRTLSDLRKEMDYNNPFQFVKLGNEIEGNVEDAAKEYDSKDPDLSLKVKMREVDEYLAAYAKYEKRLGQLKSAEVKQQQSNVKEKERIEVLKKKAKENPQAFADPIKNVDVDLVSWEKGGFGLVALATIKLVNDNPYPVSDWEINCIGYAPSGTKIGINRKTAYETVPAFSKKTVYDFNMGFQNEQVKSMACTVRAVRR